MPVDITAAATDAGSLDSVIARACSYLERNFENRVTLAQIGRHVGLSPSHLQRVFKAKTGVSPQEYVVALRVERLKNELRSTPSTVARASIDAGFGSHSGAYETAAAHLAMTPATYAAGGAGVNIRFAVTDSPFGKVLIAATEKGVCAVSLGNTATALRAALRQEYPRAKIIEGRDELVGLCDAIIANTVGGRDHADIPIDVAGTAFQWEVWRALRAIPVGETRSYKQVAESIGRPTAVRAVARACASNHVALVIPCHRVVRSDRSTSGYRWGPDRKQALLEHESAQATGQRKPANSPEDSKS